MSWAVQLPGQFRDNVAGTAPVLASEGEEQLRAGLALIKWSGLARWDDAANILVPVPKDEFESAHLGIHETYGRLISWIAFGVGSEYLVKGACLLAGIDLRENGKSIVAPLEDEDVDEWAGKLAKAQQSFEQDEVSFGTFGKLAERACTIPTPKKDQDLVFAA
jgi:hypothetical protein